MTNILDPFTASRVSQPQSDHVTAGTMAFLWSRTDMLKEVWQLVQTVGGWRAAIRPDAHGLCLSLGGVSLGHLNWQGRIELPFGSQIRRYVLEEGLASPDRYRPDTARLVFEIRNIADVERVIWVLRLAYLMDDRQTVRTCN